MTENVFCICMLSVHWNYVQEKTVEIVKEIVSVAIENPGYEINYIFNFV